jgi:glutathione S-transferase
MVQIYGSPKSSAGRCYWALEEAGIPYERVEISFSDKEHKSPEFLALNPNGKVPVFVDGDLVLWESVAINRYIFEKYKPGLLGATLAERALTDQWSLWSQLQYQVPVIDLFIQLVFVPEGKRDEAVMAKARSKIGPLNQLLDTQLAKTGQVVGETFTFADLNMASVARLNARLGIDLSECPNLVGWLERTLARPACQRVDAMP